MKWADICMFESSNLSVQELVRLHEKRYTDKELEVLRELSEDSLIYTAALKELQARVEILRDDYKRKNAYNPIEHIKTRIKQPCSILKKVYLRGIDLNADTIREELNDLAGIRIICTFKKDIYEVANIIQNSDFIEVKQIKDYVKNPKESGYQSYHIIVYVPVHLIDGVKKCKVEIQLRTMAMDFWACLEHKIKYKFDFDVPEYIKSELRESSKMVRTLDSQMQALHLMVAEEVPKNW